jgi:SIR2-like domain
VLLDEIIKFIQTQFTDGLVIVIGSGLSFAEGIPGMPELTEHLVSSAKSLTGTDASLWHQIQASLGTGMGLEAALQKHAPTASLEEWVVTQTCNLLIPAEKLVIGEVATGARTLRLTSFMRRVIRPTNGIPILTPNYDRLVEVACEAAGFHVDTTAIGDYMAGFDHKKSYMRSCRGILPRAGKTPRLDHAPRVVVLKPHGSLDWFRGESHPVRSSIDIEAERLMITPGANKYKAGYQAPFDKHRDLANEYIDGSARLLVVGYGFNDDHLQTHLERRILSGVPTLILSRSVGPRVEAMTKKSSRCLCLYRPASVLGVGILENGNRTEETGHEYWDLGVLTKELLT